MNVFSSSLRNDWKKYATLEICADDAAPPPQNFWTRRRPSKLTGAQPTPWSRRRALARTAIKLHMTREPEEDQDKWCWIRWWQVDMESLEKRPYCEGSVDVGHLNLPIRRRESEPKGRPTSRQQWIYLFSVSRLRPLHVLVCWLLCGCFSRWRAIAYISWHAALHAAIFQPYWGVYNPCTRCKPIYTVYR